MLVRLSPEQIVIYWERLRPTFIENLLPKVDKTPETVFRVLQSLLTESLQLWAGYEEGESPIEERIYGFIATSIDIDSISQERNLLIYSLFAVKKIPIEAWEEGIKILEEYKKLNKCSKLIAYTEVPEVLQLTKKLGFKSSSFLVKED